MTSKDVSRRSFLASALLVGATAATATAGLAACTDDDQEDDTGVGGASVGGSSDSETTDIVIVGAGLAGLVAGLKALELGAKATIIEKQPEGKIGGNSIIAGGLFALPMQDTAQQVEIYYQDMMHKSSDQADPALTRKMAENAYESYYWLLDQGAELADPYQILPYQVNGVFAKPALYQGMPAVFDLLLKNYLDAGGVIHYDSKFKSLVTDNKTGRVVGATAKGPDGLIEIVGKAVILASGGYAGNKLLLEQYLGADADLSMVRGCTYMTGDALAPAQAVGAQLLQMAGMTSVHVGAVHPDNVASSNPGTAVPWLVAINTEGKRFIDESLGYQAHGKAVMNQPGSMDALVMDSVIAEIPTVRPLTLDLYERLGITVQQSDTLEGLAAKIEVPVETFVATINEYNAHVSSDETASGMAVNKAATAFKIETPPFYAFWPLRPGITLTFGGLSIDDTCQVLEADLAPVDGLYAAGEITGGFFNNDYIGGSSLMRSLCFGLIAAESAVSSY